MAEYKRVYNFCQKDFIAQKYNTKYCSTRCASRASKMQTRQHQQNMFNDNETYKRLLNKILLSVERIEIALELQEIKEQVANDNKKHPSLVLADLEQLKRNPDKTDLLIAKGYQLSSTENGKKIFIGTLSDTVIVEKNVSANTK